MPLLRTSDPSWSFARRASGLLAAALFAGTLAPAAAGAAATYLAGVGCNGPFESQEGPAHVDEDCRNLAAASFSPEPGYQDSYARSDAGPGGLRVRSDAEVGAGGVNSGSQAVGAQAWAEWTFDDFVVVGTGTGSVPILAALNLQVSGFLSPGGALFDLAGPLTSTVGANAQFYLLIDIDGGDAGYGGVSRSISNGSLSEFAEGLLEDHYSSGEEISDSITSSQVMVPVGSEFTVHVYVNAGTTSSATVQGTPADENDFTLFLGEATSDFSATVKFPTSGPVFALPAGYTVHSASAGIVDNAVVVPEPAGILLVATAAAAFCVRFRGRGGCRPRSRARATGTAAPGLPHGMCTTHAEVVNPDLLAFIKR
jgi:hypothetical protein